MMRLSVRLGVAATIFAGALLASPLPATEPGQPPGAGASNTGLPVPRYVSLRSSEVNLRTGPGVRYPVEWVFVRQGMPVEITAEFDTWRRIRDWEGSEGWVHQSMLSGRRAVVVIGDTRLVRRVAESSAPAVARAEPGVVGWLKKCERDWCEVDVSGYRGWLKRAEFWGVYENEKVE